MTPRRGAPRCRPNWPRGRASIFSNTPITGVDSGFPNPALDRASKYEKARKRFKANVAQVNKACRVQQTTKSSAQLEAVLVAVVESINAHYANMKKALSLPMS